MKINKPPLTADFGKRKNDPYSEEWFEKQNEEFTDDKTKLSKNIYSDLESKSGLEVSIKSRKSIKRDRS